MVARVYAAYGLNVLSEVEVGLPVPEGAAADTTMVLGPPSDRTNDLPPGPIVAGNRRGSSFRTALAVTENGYLLRVRSLADIWITSDGRYASYHPATGSDPLNLRDLSTTIISYMLPLRGITPLHSSCVTDVPGLSHLKGAVALMGGSAAGKSTLAGLLSAAGAGFITDDLLPLRVGDDKPFILGGCPELRVRETATELLEALASRPARATADARTAFLLGEVRAYPIEVGLVLIPEFTPGAERTTVTMVGQPDALMTLLLMGRSGGWALSEVQEAFFSVVAAIVNTAPVLKVRWSPTTLDIRLLVEDVAEVLGA